MPQWGNSECDWSEEDLVPFPIAQPPLNQIKKSVLDVCRQVGLVLEIGTVALLPRVQVKLVPRGIAGRHHYQLNFKNLASDKYAIG